MEKSLDLDDISLIPAYLNQGFLGNYDFAIYEGQEKFLPIFTRPIQSIITKDNCDMWASNGIRPIIPITEEFSIRIQACQRYFTAFTLQEIKDNFIAKPQRNPISRIYIEHVNGHDVDILNTSQKLKSLYGDRLLIMAGPIANPKTYIDYCKAGIDYTRVGMSIGSQDNPYKYGFHYPIAGILMDIRLQLKAAIGFKQSRIVVDGGVLKQSDIVKCIALGADCVIIGNEFSKLLESAGPICKKVVTADTSYEKVENLSDFPKEVLDKNKFYREYVPGIWNRVNKSLVKDWLPEMYDNFNYAFMMANARNWMEFKKNINFIVTD